MALIQAFIPGASPPEVNKAIFFILQFSLKTAAISDKIGYKIALDLIQGAIPVAFVSEVEDPDLNQGVLRENINVALKRYKRMLVLKKFGHSDEKLIVSFLKLHFDYIYLVSTLVNINFNSH